MKYQLPCSCGKSVMIEPSQAGQIVHCGCGAPLEVPTMRLIRQLKPAETAGQSGATTVGEWSVASRALVTLGLAVMMLGLSLAGFYQFGRSSLDTEEVEWDRTLDSDISKLSNMNLDEAWKNWELVRDSGIGPYQPPRYILSRELSTYWKKYVLIGLGIAFGGVLTICLGLMLPREVAPVPGRPARRN